MIVDLEQMKSRKVKQNALIGWWSRANSLLSSFHCPFVNSESCLSSDLLVLRSRISSPSISARELSTATQFEIYASHRAEPRLHHGTTLAGREAEQHPLGGELNLMHYEGYNIAFALHVAIEIPAAMIFMLYPSRQLGEYSPHAHAIVRQYALLLLASALISLAFITRPTDDLSRAVAGSLGIYHVGPALRSSSRLQRLSAQNGAFLLSEAFLYLVLHVVCGTLLFLCYLGR